METLSVTKVSINYFPLFFDERLHPGKPPRAKRMEINNLRLPGSS
jgi:hypothetical protein